MTKSSTYKDQGVDPTKLQSDTFYVGDKGDEIADYSYNYKIGTTIIKSTSKFFYGTSFNDALVDLGAGNCEKASELFDSIKPKKYRALDISQEFLELALMDLQKRYPEIKMDAQICDLNEDLYLPDSVGSISPHLTIIRVLSKMFRKHGFIFSNPRKRDCGMDLSGSRQIIRNLMCGGKIWISK